VAILWATIVLVTDVTTSEIKRILSRVLSTSDQDYVTRQLVYFQMIAKIERIVMGLYRSGIEQGISTQKEQQAEQAKQLYELLQSIVNGKENNNIIKTLTKRTK
jgi:hypothetical protein